MGVSQKGMLWRLIILAIWWSFWLEQKKCVFDNCSKPSYMVHRRAKERCLF